MKQIAAEYWLNYIKVNTGANKIAARQMERYIEANGTEDMEKLTTFAHGLVTKYGEASAALSCEVYESTARAQGADIPPAEPAETASYDEVSKAVRGAAKRSPRMIPDTVGRLVKQAGADTTLKNALRDGAYFAWVPHGDACPFCNMLAGNGWQRASKKTVKGDHAEHIHANCDCEFAVSFGGPGKVEGYAPEKYRAMYDSAEGGTWREKLNAMRRQQYAENKDRINAQKREAYARSRDIPLGSSLDGYTRGQKKTIQNLLKQAPSEVREVFAKHGVRFDAIDGNVDLNIGCAYFSPRDGRVHMFIKDTVSGNDYETPFQTHFHEFAHNLDYLAGNSKDFFSLSWRSKNGETLEDIIERDWDKALKDFFFTDTKHGYMQALEGQFGSGGQGGGETFLRNALANWRQINRLGRHDSEYLKLKNELDALDGTSDSYLKFWEKHFDTFKDVSYNNFVNREDVLEAFIKDLKGSLSKRERLDISDMLERYAIKLNGSKYERPLGWGHGKDYASVRGNLTVEAFAEMTSATITNPDSLAQIKKYLPNTYNAYLEILREMV